MKTAAGESFLHGEVKAFKMQNGRIGGADHREDAKGQSHLTDEARTESLKISRELEETNQKTHCLGWY